MNTYYGNGLATSKDSPTSTHSNNFGIGLVFASNGNVVEGNKLGGNVNGVYIDAHGDVGNVIRSNIVIGNPPGQVSTEFGASIGADIQDMSAPGANTFEDNRCLTYAGAAEPAPCPSIPKDDDGEALRGEGVPPDSAIAQTQRADIGLNNFAHQQVQTFLCGTTALLIVGLAVPKRRYRNLSGKK